MKLFAAALCLFSSPVLAQITPADVLLNWQGLSERNEMGFAFERQQAEAGEITLYNVQLGGGVSAVLPWLKLVATPNGAVNISTVESVTWENPVLANAPDFTTSGVAHLHGLLLQASGTPDDVRYTFSLNTYSDDTTDTYREMVTQTATTLHGLSGVFTHHPSADTGDVFVIEIAAAFWETNTASIVRGENNGQHYNSMSNFTIEAEFSPSSFATRTLKFASGPLVQRTNSGTRSNSVFSASAAEFSASSDLENPNLQLALCDVSVAIQSTSLWLLNLDISFKSLLLDASASNRSANAPYPWQLEARLEGLVHSPETWAMLDPESALPHEASHLVARLNGIGKRLEEEATMQPFIWLSEMRALDLETLDVNFGGLSLLASGAVSFKADTFSLYGLPMPDGGQLSLRMQGAETLLAALSSELMDFSFLNDLLATVSPAGQPTDDLDVQIMFDAEGGVSVE